MRIAFRPATPTDLDLLSWWMAEPHWHEWWGDPETELAVIREMIDGAERTRPYIFQVGGRDTGYIQVWFVDEEQNRNAADKEPWIDLLPAEAVGIDLSIGRKLDLGQGIGTAVLKVFVFDLRRQGHHKILIDPDPRNARAIKSYRKAGFEEVQDLLGKTGDCLIMEHTNQESVS